MPEEKKRERPRPRSITIELTESERAKLDRLKTKRGERATLASTIRSLIMEAK